MQKLAKIVNAEIMEMTVALSEMPDEQYFINQGFSYQNVEQAKDGRWFLEGYCPAPTYIELRREAYPSIQEQLDMLYWDMVNGTENWKDMISEIKSKYPKPSNQVSKQVEEV